MARIRRKNRRKIRAEPHARPKATPTFIARSLKTCTRPDNHEEKRAPLPLPSFQGETVCRRQVGRVDGAASPVYNPPASLRSAPLIREGKKKMAHFPLSLTSLKENLFPLPSFQGATVCRRQVGRVDGAASPFTTLPPPPLGAPYKGGQWE